MSISFCIRAAMEQQELETSYKNVGFTAYFWQENAITTLTPSDKKKQPSFHPCNLNSSKTCRLGSLCTSGTEAECVVYGRVEWETKAF